MITQSHMQVCMQMYPLFDSTCIRYWFRHHRYVTEFCSYSLLVPSSEPEPIIIVTDPHYWIRNFSRIPLLNRLLALDPHFWTKSHHRTEFYTPWCMNSTITCKYGHHNRPHFWSCTPPIRPSPQHNGYDMQIYSTIHIHTIIHIFQILFNSS